MSAVVISYKNTEIASMDATGVKTLLTGDAFCEDNIIVSYTKPVPSLQSKSASYTPSETAQSGTITPDSGYDGLNQVSVSVGAISPSYVGSGVPRIGVRIYRPITTDQTISPGQYIDGLFVSEDMGVAKPDAAFFDLCLEKIGEPKASCIMIGDSLTSDMLGAKNAGMDSVWFMPAGDVEEAMKAYDINYCASSYDELFEILQRWPAVT